MAGSDQRALLWTVVHVPLRVTFTLHPGRPQGRQKAGPVRTRPHLPAGWIPTPGGADIPVAWPGPSLPEAPSAVTLPLGSGTRAAPGPHLHVTLPPARPPPPRAQWGFSKARVGCPPAARPPEPARALGIPEKLGFFSGNLCKCLQGFSCHIYAVHCLLFRRGLHPEMSSRCPVSRMVPGQCPSGVSVDRQDNQGRAGEAVGVTVSVGVTHEG